MFTSIGVYTISYKHFLFVKFETKHLSALKKYNTNISTDWSEWHLMTRNFKLESWRKTLHILKGRKWILWMVYLRCFEMVQYCYMIHWKVCKQNHLSVFLYSFSFSLYEWTTKSLSAYFVSSSLCLKSIHIIF